MLWLNVNCLPGAACAWEIALPTVMNFVMPNLISLSLGQPDTLSCPQCKT